jgi:hypothetical protein
MNKIPVFATVAHAYNFAFGHFLRVLGIVWAPLIILLAMNLMMTPGFLGDHAVTPDRAEVVRQGLRMAPLSLAITLIVRAMMATGVTELALGTHKGPSFVYFSLGAPVWRFIGAWLLSVLAMFVIIIGLVIGLVILGVVGGMAFHASGLSQASSTVVTVVAVILCLFAFYAVAIYVGVRLTFLIPPVVVAESEVNLARGWQLTRGNFWRIFLVGLGVFLPLFAIGLVLFLVIYGTTFYQAIIDIIAIARQQASTDVVQQHIQQYSDAFGAKVSQESLRIWPFMAIYTLIAETIGYGLGYGASVFAYRALVSPPATAQMRG